MRSAVTALASGGLDSCVMLGELAKSYQEVYPVFVRCGLRWEENELVALQDFVDALHQERIRPIRELHFPMNDVYGSNWYTGGEAVPAYHDPDQVWEIPGRNLILISKTAVWCKLHQVEAIAIGVLRSNPFSDATPEFFEYLQHTLRQSLQFDMSLLRPLAGLHKSDVIKLGRSFPLELTLSCANPFGKIHCGVCGKCRERIDAFAKANISDPTRYHQHFAD